MSSAKIQHTPLTTNRNKIGFYDKETEKRMNVKGYPGPSPYYDDVVYEDNYIYQSGKLVENNTPLQFKYRPPGPGREPP